MSLVEKALSKMKQAERLAKQAAADSAPATPEPVAPGPCTGIDRRGRAPATPPPAAPAVAPARAMQSRQLLIDAETLRSAGYLPPPQQERELTEQYRHIKRPLVARALGRGAHAGTWRAA